MGQIHRIACAAALVLLSVGAASAQTDDPTWEQCRSSDPARAIRACTGILTRGSRESVANRGLAFMYRGRAHHALHDLYSALADYNEAIRYDPHNARAFQGRGSVHRDRGNAEAALADFNQAIRLDRMAGQRDQARAR